MNKELTDNVYETFMQFIKFGIVGLSNTGISYLIYAGSLIWFRHLNMFSESDYLIAQFVAFVLSVLWSFYWNNKMVFVIEKEKAFFLEGFGEDIYIIFVYRIISK